MVDHQADGEVVAQATVKVHVELSDYKVRILPGTHGTDAVTRVLVDTQDGTGSWTTVGVHGNVVEASWLALLDALTYAALRHDGVAAR